MADISRRGESTWEQHQRVLQEFVAKRGHFPTPAQLGPLADAIEAALERAKQNTQGPEVLTAQVDLDSLQLNYTKDHLEIQAPGASLCVQSWPEEWWQHHRAQKTSGSILPGRLTLTLLSPSAEEAPVAPDVVIGSSQEELAS